MESCIFCKIANKEIPSKVIYEDEKCLVFLDISPATKGHVLIIPKNHYADLFEIEESELFYLMGIAQKISQRLKDRLGFEGLNVVQNNGSIAGQTVFHYHIHLIPRYKHDQQKINWNPTNPSADELDLLWQQLK